MDALNYVADKFKGATDRAIDGVQTAREAAGLKHSKERVEKIAFAIEDREDETGVAREPQNPILRMGVPFPRMEAIFAANSERLHWNASRNDPTYAVAVLKLRAEDDERREAVDWAAIEERGPGEEYRRSLRGSTRTPATATSRSRPRLAVAETPHVLAHLRRREAAGSLRGHEAEASAVLANWRR
ncbi:hypothetical protein JL721_7313 [Aureococcus anophagefferens]|nr:hypothetical protein JL721_7313 [Aureococcus anophagefferens]